ncbi:DMT family transporter [Patescibacteria group bacterium]|nr:DMT family transporter [Patescibacteria group bacterium]
MSEQRKGELFSFAEAFLWGLFPVVTVITYTGVPPLVSLVWSTVFAAVLFCGFVAARKRWHELKNPLVWRYTALATLFLGVILYCLYFTGLQYTTPGNAALIALLGVFTSFLFFNVLRKERMSRSYVVGMICMVLGAGVVLAPNVGNLNIGDLYILLAACIAPFGNFYSQKAVGVASSETVMFLRSALSVPFLLIIALLAGAHATWAEIQMSLPFLLVNGLLLLGLSKMFFLEAIHRLSVTKALSLESGSVIVTLGAAWLLLEQAPTLWQVAAVIPLLLGVALLTDQVCLERRTV